jgi:hypothetical protein
VTIRLPRRRPAADPLAHALADAAPQAPEQLLRRLVARAGGAAGSARPRPRIALAAAFTVALVGGVGAFGGLGYAANQLQLLSDQLDVQHRPLAGEPTLIPHAVSAAEDQYGGIDTSENTVSVVVTPPPPPASPPPPGSPPPPPGSSANTVSITVSPTTGPLVIAAASPGATGPSGPSTTVTISAASVGDRPVVVHVDPTPPATSVPLVGAGNQVVSVIITDASTGQVIHELTAPIDIALRNPPRGYVPVTSQDGVTFRAVPLLAGSTLPPGQQDGYYVDDAGTIHILTRHVTIFAAVFKANVNVSETGKRTPEAGSGLFGDPTRSHVGPPKLAAAGGAIEPKRQRRGTFVPFTVDVDEQAALFLSITDSSGRRLQIVRDGTRVRGSRYRGTPVKSLHLVILRPGRIRTLLKVHPGALKAGRRYRIDAIAVDFDGHRVVRHTTFRG